MIQTKKKIVNILITDNDILRKSFSSVINDLNNKELSLKHAHNPSLAKLYLELNARAKKFLSDKNQLFEHEIIYGTDIHDVTGQLFLKYADNKDNLMIGIFIYFTNGIVTEKCRKIQSEINYFHGFLKHHNFIFKDSSYAALIYRTFESEGNFVSQYQGFQERIFQPDEEILNTEILYFYINYLETFHLGARSDQFTKLKNYKVTLGSELVKFLNKKATANWAFYSYTGSLVSGIIESISHEIRPIHIPVIKGPSEHSLACGAMANWQLNQMSFLIVVTSGMMDEFKGTLANLKETRAKGFIVCAETKKDAWYNFQGTINNEENMCEVLTSKRISHVYLDDVQTLPQKLAEAFELYESNNGPVVLLATNQVLEYGEELSSPINYSVNNKTEFLSTEQTSNYKDLLDTINNKNIRILWQCGLLTREERKLVYEISNKSGIAICDSISHPGSVSKYNNGKPINNYLGTLAIYCYSKSIYNYLTTNGKLNPKNEQQVFFLKSKLAKAATPFSEGKLKREINIGQVTNNDAHISPFTNMPFVTDLLSFLKQIDKGLNVQESVLKFRNRALHMAKKSTSDFASRIPSLPMSINYFHNQFNKLIESLIENNNYSYTGIYDAGRGGVTAMRNISKTDPGFTSCYGRGVMGDAYLSVNSLATTTDGNIIGFIGDGAYNLAPDIKGSLIENLIENDIKSRKNITLFIFMNGALSFINTYRHQRFLDDGGRSGIVSSIKVSNAQIKLGNYRINHYNTDRFDNETLKTLLLEKNTINFVYVKIAHNNEGDGISLLSENTWEHQLIEEKLETSQQKVETC